MEAQSLSLKTLIRAISEELAASRDERLANGRPALFKVQDLTVEVSFVVTKSKGGGGGFDLKVVKADGNVKYDQQAVHKITLKLQALSEEEDILTQLQDNSPLWQRSSDEDSVKSAS